MNNHTIYPSLTALAARADGPADIPENDHLRGELAGMRYSGARFFGLKSGQDRAAYDEIIRSGFPEGRERAEHLAHRLTLPALKSRRRRRRRGPDGDTLDRDAVNAGRLDVAWTRTVRQQTSAPPSVLIGCELAISFNQSADELVWRGVVAWVLADKLTAAGYSVRVVAADIGVDNYENGGHGPHYLTAVQLKAERSRVDPGTLLAGLAHPATTRGLIYGARAAACRGPMCNSLGRPYAAKPGDWEAVAGKSLPLIVPKYVNNQDTAQQALNDIIGGLNK